MKYLMLNYIRNLESIINEKLGLRGRIGESIALLYIFVSLIIGVVMSYAVYKNSYVALYSLLMGAWAIISLPPYHSVIRRMYFQDQLIRNMLLVPMVLVAMLCYPIWAIGVISLSLLINKYAYHRGLLLIQKGYGHYFCLICLLIMAMVKDIGIGLIATSIVALLCFQNKSYIHQKIIVGGTISSLVLWLIKNFIVQYDSSGMVSIGLYMMVLTRNALLCQQEQFLNINKSLLNTMSNIDGKFEIMQ